MVFLVYSNINDTLESEPWPKVTEQMSKNSYLKLSSLTYFPTKKISHDFIKS